MRYRMMHGKFINVGYSFEPKGLSIAPKTLANFLDRITQAKDNKGRGGNYGSLPPPCFVPLINVKSCHHRMLKMLN